MQALAVGQTYMLYGRERAGKKFRPVDLTNGHLVNKRIFGTMFFVESEEYVQRLESKMDELRSDNPEFEFQLRRVN